MTSVNALLATPGDGWFVNPAVGWQELTAKHLATVLGLRRQSVAARSHAIPAARPQTTRLRLLPATLLVGLRGGQQLTGGRHATIVQPPKRQGNPFVHDHVRGGFV